MWEPKFALSISVELRKIGNPKFPKGLRYLISHTPNNQKHENIDEKYENQKESKKCFILNLRMSVTTR